MEGKCIISGKTFTVSAHEKNLREKFGWGEIAPSFLPKYRFQHLGAFWPHWNLYKRKCDKTGKPMISIFRPDCVYPVWHRDEWIASATPPSQEFDFSRPFFEQAWDLFQRCPIPHAFQSNNQNCEYTDDWYYSKNCYLCHSGQGNEDCRYCYGCDSIKNVYYGVFCFQSELCTDLINSSFCFNSLYLVNCKNVYDSAFSYDCRNCSDCLFCFNLRDKKYCFENEQLTKEEFEKKKKEWDFSSHKNYEAAKKFFNELMRTKAWHRALQIDLCENSTGNYIRNSKNCENCYLLSDHEDCANVAFCGPRAKTILDSIGTVGSELTYMSSLPVYSYRAEFCFSVSHSRFVQYSAYLQNCQYCFGCCGLVNAKYHIFNKPYSKEEYETLVPRIIEAMKQTGEWGTFFPPHFAPNPYEESFSGYHFPLTKDNSMGFRWADNLEKSTIKTAERSEIPDRAGDLSADQEKNLLSKIFWDEDYQRPFQLSGEDIRRARELNEPLQQCYYVHRMQDNLKWIPFKGELRKTKCATSGKDIETAWPEQYDRRILSEEEYLKLVR